MQEKKKNYLLSIIFTLVIVLFTILAMSTNMLRAIDNFNYDFVLEKSNDFSDNIVIVAIDDESLNSLGKFSEWDRGYFAKVINKINEFNPSVIGVDVEFFDPSSGDSSLALALKDSNNIVFASKLETKTRFNEEESVIEKYVTEQKPIDVFYNELGSDGIGFANTLADKDGYVRNATINATFDDVSYSSFAEQIYKKYALANDFDYTEYKTNKRYLINYNAKPGAGYDVLSFNSIYNDTYSDVIYKDYFEDKIVLIGAYASGLSDDYFSPISHNIKMNGVEIHANILNNMYNDMFIKNANKALQYILNILFVIVVIFLITRFNFLYSTITALVAIIFEYVLGIILYNANIYYPTVSLCIILFIGYVIVVVYHYVRERMEKGAVLKTFKQYMAPQVVEAFLKDNKQSSNLVGERRDVACLFVDIRGFTRMSETLVDPIKVVKILNDYLGMTTKQIFDNDGMLDKFIGDACMAIFNAPFDIDDYEFKAIKAGLGIVKYGEPIAKQVFEDYGITIGFGVGVNCGEAIIGNIGCDFRKDYTGIGDTINTASRLESNAKGGQVIISEETLNRVDENGNYKLKNRLIVEENGYLNLKGKAKPVLTYNVIGIKENNDEINEVKEENNEENTNDSSN